MLAWPCWDVRRESYQRPACPPRRRERPAHSGLGRGLRSPPRLGRDMQRNWPHTGPSRARLGRGASPGLWPPSVPARSTSRGPPGERLPPSAAGRDMSVDRSSRWASSDPGHLALVVLVPLDRLAGIRPYFAVDDRYGEEVHWARGGPSRYLPPNVEQGTVAGAMELAFRRRPGHRASQVCAAVPEGEEPFGKPGEVKAAGTDMAHRADRELIHSAGAPQPAQAPPPGPPAGAAALRRDLLASS